MKTIKPDDLIDMNALTDREPVRVDLVYADACHRNNIFGAALYRKDARLWLHRDFAGIVIAAARLMRDKHEGRLVLKDGLRPVEAQALMQETAIVKTHPEWCNGPNRLLSKPGQGGHPRGMAVDVAVEDIASSQAWDMGTVFDTMTPQSARAYTGFSDSILNNRKKLEAAFTDSAASLGLPILPLPSEWWDFRFPASYSERYAPISNADLPETMRMM